MNGDLISRRALLEKVNERYHDPYFDVCLRKAPTIEAVPLADIYRIIAGHSDYHGDNILAALTCIAEGKAVNPVKLLEAEPVRHGRWISCSDKHAFSEECSVCGEGVLWDDGQLHHYNYCPHCGAKMESGTVLSESEPLAGCVDDADLEHMTRFAMQQAINRK